MAGDIRIANSQIISGSRISHSRVDNVTSQASATMTPEMWETVFRLVDRYGKSREVDGARELKALVDQNRGREATSIWRHLRAFLGDFANVSKIVETIDTLTR